MPNTSKNSKSDELFPETLKAFEWAVFLYNGLGEDEAYIDTMQILPEFLKEADFSSSSDEIIRFLNKWRSRRGKESKKGIKEWLENNYTDLKRLNISLKELKEDDYSKLANNFGSLIAKPGIGPTTAAKVLHILKPKLFVAWDIPIAEKYIGKNDTEGYVSFLRAMQSFAYKVDKWKLGEAEYLSNEIANLYSQKLSLLEGKPKEQLEKEIEFLRRNGKELPKFLDEYNWVTITNHTVLPPTWRFL